jgi:uncharacterized protein (TIGR00725 family)
VPVVEPRAPLIAVCGASAATPEEMAVAEEVGQLLAKRGAVVVCGGLFGVMEGVCRGVSGAGGMSIGLLPGEDPGAANAFVSLALATGLGELRNGLIARSCQGMIAIGGGYGTLSEIALMLRLGRPVCAVSSWKLVPPRGDAADVAIHRAADAAAAVAWLMERVGAEGSTG